MQRGWITSWWRFRPILGVDRNHNASSCSLEEHGAVTRIIMKNFLLAGVFLAANVLACTSFSNNPTCDDNWNIFQSSPPPFGKEFNSTREELGLPIIPGDWEADSYRGQEYIGWSNPKSSE